MCPACISTAAAIAAGVVSSGGLAVLAIATFGPRPSRTSNELIDQTQGDDHGTAENRAAR
jgi:hypothetical protein